ncbi:nitrate- and nitrite sensing domain-containing protein [Streptomyces sp. LX-29]|uniref:sensor histidine kinase n=1 Tax=Streptomyces sp. LX-29 TaxID=2900152 RepID=UPI00240E9A66|nr:nitrate- and nitrite sensing domain-containing protein [Streptomyces sp. LX-29]WFB06319.1 nitrate- and nitrite sensing domain-containing protein [Streptomyces sp. LX-29]
MRFRGKSIRRKIVALLLVPLVSLTALWAFATVITGREAMQLLDAADIVDDVGYPVEDAVHALQKERRQTLIRLADPEQADALPVLHARQRETNQVMVKLRANASDGDIRDKMSGESRAQLAAILEGADGLDTLRRKVEDRTITSLAAYDAYNKLVDLCYTFRSSLHSVPDADLDKQGRALVAMIRAREALSREDALFMGALTAKKMTGRDMRAISDLIAERNLLYATNMPILPVSEQKVFQDYRRNTAAPEALRIAEDKILTGGASRVLKVMDQDRWEAAAKPVLDDYDRLNSEATDRFKDRVEPEAESVLLQAGIAGIAGFLALVASIFVSVRIGRNLVRDLNRLRKDAHEVASVRLPSVMRRLGAGEQVDVETEAPRLEYGSDEMGQVGQALNTLQRAAVEAAVKQADMRHGVSEVFVNLARRSQVLLHRQLTLLDEMERRTEDTDELADLFRLDHMTTRMRRHAEGLVILSGAAPSRQWRKPIQLMDVVRAAVAEVEDYERIEVRRLPRLAVNGPAVADLTHLIAELLENATVFSPPHTVVQVHGERVANGFTLEIHDRGLGMAGDALLEANLRLAETPDFELSDTDRLGLFVVSRLAQRQGVRVSLQPSPYGGTTAVVLIPATLLTGTDPDGDGEEGPTPDDGGIFEALAGASGGSAASIGLQSVDDPAGRPDRAAPTPARLDGWDADGPAERGAPASRFDLAARPHPLPGAHGAPDPADLEDDEEEGGLFRSRGLTGMPPAQSSPPARPLSPELPPPSASSTPPMRSVQAPAAERRPSPEGSGSGGPAEPAPPLPRRVPPVLVSDHGRPVGRHARGPAEDAPGNGGVDARGIDHRDGDARGADARGVGAPDQGAGAPGNAPRAAHGGGAGLPNGPQGAQGGYGHGGGAAGDAGWSGAHPGASDTGHDPAGHDPVPLPRQRGWDPHAGQPAPPASGPSVPRQGPGAGRPAAPEPVRPRPDHPTLPDESTLALPRRTPEGLPRRIRQANLAPQLKNAPATRTEAERYPAETDPERDAEQARATMASLQRGWQRGRRQGATPGGSRDTAARPGGRDQTAPGTNYEGDGR